MKAFIILLIGCLIQINGILLWQDISGLLYITMHTDNSVYPNRKCVAVILSRKIAISSANCFKISKISQIKVFEYLDSDIFIPSSDRLHSHNLTKSLNKSHYIDTIRFDQNNYYIVKIHYSPEIILDSGTADRDSESILLYYL